MSDIITKSKFKTKNGANYRIHHFETEMEQIVGFSETNISFFNENNEGTLTKLDCSDSLVEKRVFVELAAENRTRNVELIPPENGSEVIAMFSCGDSDSLEQIEFFAPDGYIIHKSIIATLSNGQHAYDIVVSKGTVEYVRFWMINEKNIVFAEIHQNLI